MYYIKKLSVAAALTFFALAGVNAQAGPIVGPVAVSASIGDLSICPNYCINNLINQSGLSASYVSGVTDFSAFVATTTMTGSPSDGWANGSGWASTLFNVFPAFINFDLGALTSVTRMALWNDTDTQALGAFEIFASADSTYTNLLSLGTFNATEQMVGTLAQLFDFTDATTRYISIAGSPVLYNNGLLNIGEIAFESTPGSSIPEPGTLMLVAASLLGLALSRRKSKA